MRLLRVFSYTSDRGSDQVAVRRLIAHEVLPCSKVLFLEFDCIMHATTAPRHIVQSHGKDVLIDLFRMALHMMPEDELQERRMSADELTDWFLHCHGAHNNM